MVALPPDYESSYEASTPNALPKNGECAYSLEKSINELERAAFKNWASFIQLATTLEHTKQDITILVDCQNHLPFSKAFLPFTSLFYDEISLHLKRKPFTLSNTALANLVTGLLQDYIEACGLTLYCTIQDEIPNRDQTDYESWVENFYKTRWPSFTAEYTVIGILLKQRYDQYYKHCCEVFDRLEHDISLIESTFKVEIKHLSSLGFRLSDRHNHGKSVCEIEINGTFKIIYKPKPLKNEAWIQNLLRTNIGFKDSKIGQYNVIDRGTYGWSEYILPHENIKHSTDDVIESYSSLLALAYLINASDLHTENAMVCNNKFYPADFETIFNPPVKKLGHKMNWRDYNIFFTGMLFDDLDIHLKQPDDKKHYYSNENIHPTYHIISDKASGVSLHIQGVCKNSEEEKKFRPSKLSKKEWLRLIDKTQQKILKYKNYLTTDDIFKRDVLHCRHVPRNTSFYARIQQVLYHPYKLKNFKDWENYISQIIETIDQDKIISNQNEINLINSEILQLKRGDIPYFTYTSNSKNLQADNVVIIDDFFEITGKKAVQKKLKEITKMDATEIKNLMTAKYIVWNQKPINYQCVYIKEQKKDILPRSDEQILTTVKNIAETIISAANICKNQPARWLSHEGDVTSLAAAHIAGSFSFFNGYWGIMVFLFAAVKSLPVNKSSLIQDFIDREIKIWLSDKKPQLFFSYTGLSGLAGCVRALSIIDLIHYSNAPIMLQKIHGDGDKIYKALEKKFDEKEFTDIDYMAGKLGLLSILHNVPNDFKNEDILMPCLDKYHNDILTHWNRYISRKDKALVGYAHGISALIHHLALCLSSQEKIDKGLVQEILSKAWNYDQSCRTAESFLWADNRFLDTKPVNRSWCHGLAGIAMARLSLIKINDYRSTALKDLNFILHYIEKENKTSGSHHLCCGDCGEIDFLIEASKIGSLSYTAKKLLALQIPTILSHIKNGQTFHGTAGKINPYMSPDLFQGAAGIGYTLLRVRDNSLPVLY